MQVSDAAIAHVGGGGASCFLPLSALVSFPCPPYRGRDSCKTGRVAGAPAHPAPSPLPQGLSTLPSLFLVQTSLCPPRTVSLPTPCPCFACGRDSRHGPTPSLRPPLPRPLSRPCPSETRPQGAQPPSHPLLDPSHDAKDQGGALGGGRRRTGSPLLCKTRAFSKGGEMLLLLLLLLHFPLLGAAPPLFLFPSSSSPPCPSGFRRDEGRAFQGR